MDPTPTTDLIANTPSYGQLATVTNLDDYRARRATGRLSSTSTRPTGCRPDLISHIQTIDDEPYWPEEQT